jgi:cellulose synthase/poly-beta-1,6-N-acetylglucosamine synthase-like glycosyltransferase
MASTIAIHARTIKKDAIASIPKIALVIFAHDEASVIEKSVRSAQKSLCGNDALFVIADTCSDDTATRARKAGARVFSRDNGSPNGKGAALAWFVRCQWSLLRQFRMLVILDADTLIPPDFVRNFKASLNPGDLAVQCFVHPIEYEKSSISTLIALSEIVEQSVFDRIRSFFKWSVRLRGTGMGISPNLLLEVSSQVQTEVEDIAISLLLAEKKIKVKQLDSVMVYDPKPVEAAAASRQRARWFRGQWAVLWLYRPVVLRIAAQGPAGWSLLGSLFLKPRWLMMAIKLGLACIFFRDTLWSAFFGSLVLIDLLLILTGILRLKDKWMFVKAILHLPGFVFMWLKSILLAFRGHSWLRVRTSATVPVTTGLPQPGFTKPVKIN